MPDDLVPDGSGEQNEPQDPDNLIGYDTDDRPYDEPLDEPQDGEPQDGAPEDADADAGAADTPEGAQPPAGQTFSALTAGMTTEERAVLLERFYDDPIAVIEELSERKYREREMERLGEQELYRKRGYTPAFVQEYGDELRMVRAAMPRKNAAGETIQPEVREEWAFWTTMAARAERSGDRAGELERAARLLRGEAAPPSAPDRAQPRRETPLPPAERMPSPSVAPDRTAEARLARRDNGAYQRGKISKALGFQIPEE